MSGSFSQWLIDTFIYSGILIGLVLILRRPIAQYFGAKLAYALWLLPLLRFVMPPIVLPATMAPTLSEITPIEAAPVQAAASNADPLMLIVTGPADSAIAPVLDSAPVLQNAAVAGLAPIDLLLPIWLIGAALLLGWRLRSYLHMRRDLLADARDVGEVGKVRLVETPAVSSPIAFGVFDKVVALPPHFIEQYELNARDFAIAHELAHHHGHDLLANIVAQPLLALHWFNPLAWWGWRAMRKDQEAACDARVIAGKGKSERAAYAEVIAGFATGNHHALAAPMACPVLGEKSIIHRLRSLTMTDISNRRRNIGIAALTSTALILPLTASISYAQPEREELTLPPEPPVAPLPPSAPDAPPAPGAPEAPSIEDIDPDVHVFVNHDDDENGHRLHVIRREFHGAIGGEHALSEDEIAEILAEVERDLEGMDEEIRGEVQMALREAHTARAEAMAHGAQARAEAMAHGAQARAEAMAHRVIVIDEAGEQSRTLNMRCNGEDSVVERELENGGRAVMVCKSSIQRTVITSLQAARSAIASSPDIPPAEREEALREIDREIESARSNEQFSFRINSQQFAALRVPLGVTRINFAQPIMHVRALYDGEVAVAPVRTVQPVVQMRFSVRRVENHAFHSDCENENAEHAVSSRITV